MFMLIVMLLAVTAATAQNTFVVNLADSVEQLNEQCPLRDKDGVGFDSFTMLGDSCALVDVILPTNLAMVLDVLTEDREAVRLMWIRQFTGDPWDRLVKLMVEADLPIVLCLRPEGRKKTARVTLYPADFKKSGYRGAGTADVRQP